MASAGCKVNFDRIPGDATDGDDNGDATDAATGIRALQWVKAPSLMMAGSIQASLPSAPTVGSTIVTFFWSWTNNATVIAASSAQDSHSNTFSLASSRYTAAGACALGIGGGGIFVAPVTNLGGDPYTVTLTPMGDTFQQLGLAVVEYSGLSATPVKDASSLETSGDTPLVFGSGTVDVEPATLVVTLATECGGYPNPVTWTTGFQVRGVETETDNVPPGICGDRVVSTSGSFAESLTVAYGGAGPVPAIAIAAALR